MRKIFLCLFTLLFASTAYSGPEAGYVMLNSVKTWVPGQTNYRINPIKPPSNKPAIYIPEGAISVKVYCSVDPNALTTFSARVGSVTSGQIPSGTLSSAGFTVDQLIIGDQFGRNSSGYLRIVSSGATHKGQWLYIFIKGQTPRNINATITVDPVKYKAWYDLVTWGPDGNPVEGAAVIPTPTPVPCTPVKISVSATDKLIIDKCGFCWDIK